MFGYFELIVCTSAHKIQPSIPSGSKTTTLVYFTPGLTYSMPREGAPKVMSQEAETGQAQRLAASPHRPAIPSLLMANVRSLYNKTDHIQLLRFVQPDVKDYTVLIFTERWLNYHLHN